MPVYLPQKHVGTEVQLIGFPHTLQAEQARVAAEAASNEGTEADRAAQSDGGDTEDEGSVSEEGDGDESALPNIEILSDDTDETW